MDPFDEEFPTLGHNSDSETTSPASLSMYSSCDGSDFDRYCSANSVLGTASVCSSVANCSDLFDSLRSPGLGEDFENGGGGGERFLRSGNGRSGDISASGRLDFLSNVAGDSHLGNGSNPGNIFLKSLAMLPGSCSNEDHDNRTSNVENGSIKKPLPFQHISVDGDYHENSDETSSHHPGPSEGKHISSKLYLQEAISQKKHEQNSFLLDDEDIDSICGNSGNEDNMLDSGTDEEAQIRSCQSANLQRVKATNGQNVSPLLMGPAVAFGDNDWDDFVQEMGADDSTLSAFIPLNGENSFLQSDNEEVFMEPTTFGHSVNSNTQGTGQEGIARNMSFSSSGVTMYGLTTNVKGNHDSKEFKDKLFLSSGDTIEGSCAHGSNDNPEGCSSVEESQLVFGEDITDGNVDNGPKNCNKSNFVLPTLQNSMPTDCVSSEVCMLKETGSSAEHKSVATQPLVEKGDDSFKMDEKAAVIGEIEKLGTDENFGDMVLEMEEILLNSGQSLQARNILSAIQEASQHSPNFRDGSSTASTSGAHDAYSLGQFPAKIEWVEVVGAKQKKGDVSFGERLIGVKEYTVYRLRVRCGNDLWEVERRYRDFFSLYRQLKKMFSGHGLRLPSPWSKVDQESRKLFGNASPHVVSERSALIQDCLQSILTLRTPFGTPSPFVSFLTENNHLTNLSNNLLPSSTQATVDDVQSRSSQCGISHKEDFAMGQTISLSVELKIQKSMRQLLEEQCYTCIGCHRCLGSEKSLMQEFAQTLGWGKPRLCEYTGQLFCTKCHINDTAVLPARILHHWDFSLYSVSQLAKAYLESIYEQPMLCVTAVNPFLFSKVPALRHVMDIRKKISSMLPYVRCPFRRSIQRGLGSRRYLLQSNDFFAIRDLVDLSKGAFSALPLMVDNISSKILHHITHECLECYDVGVPCAAKEACKDPISLIFPFQEAEAARCASCGSLFHEGCFAQLVCCPCGRTGSTADTRRVCQVGCNLKDTELNNIMNLQIQKNDVGSSTGFFSDILSKAIPERLWKPRSNNHVILMGSLPSNSL